MILSLSPPSSGVRLLGSAELQDFGKHREPNAWAFNHDHVVIFAVMHWISIHWRPIPASDQTEHETDEWLF